LMASHFLWGELVFDLQVCGHFNVFQLTGFCCGYDD
jgi:hypothetical protein